VNKKADIFRLGLCCIFNKENIRFRHLTAASLKSLSKKEAFKKISEICLHNARSLLLSLETINKLNIKAFRILSQFFPLCTHPEYSYDIGSLPDRREIESVLDSVRKYRFDNDIRLSFHPDQFVVLSSPHGHIVENSVRELEYECLAAELTGAENVNVHAGGVYGDKKESLKRLVRVYKKLPSTIKKHLTFENDDISYNFEDILFLASETGAPPVYDVHHHRCNPDRLSIEAATEKAVAFWTSLGREPHFHISSPKDGWNSRNPRKHSDYIDIKDFPECWFGLYTKVTIDVEAKAKESAVSDLARKLLRVKE